MPQDIEPLKFAIVIPAHNEEQYIGTCIKSLLNQSLEPQKIVIVDDCSTDSTFKIIKEYHKVSEKIESLKLETSPEHQPGAKVVNAFKAGLSIIDLSKFDVICKFDADLEFPADYLQMLNQIFINDSCIGLCGGICSVMKNNKWQIEHLTNADHVRGALKAYRVSAFKSISGLQSQMGWDTADEFKLRFRNWKIKVEKKLIVKHYKPTTALYQDSYFKKQGEVFYALRYGLLLTFIAALKIAINKGNFLKYKLVVNAYNTAKSKDINHLLTKEEGRYLRKYRWREIVKKILP